MSQRSPLKPSKGPRGSKVGTAIGESEKQVRTRRHKKRELKPRELKFVKAKAEGKSNLQAAKIATGTTNDASAGVMGHHMAKDPTIQQAVAQALADAGITLPKAIQPIAEGLEATRDIYDKEGNFVDSNPDHTTRLKASGMALDLMGARKQQDGSPNVHFHLYAGQQRDNYGI